MTPIMRKNDSDQGRSMTYISLGIDLNQF